MSDAMYPSTTREAAQKRRELSPATEQAFQAFSQKVFAEGTLSIKMKQLIPVAVAHVTQCPYCIKGSHQGGAAAWSVARGADGGDLGRSRNAGGRRLRPFDPGDRGNGESCGAKKRVSRRAAESA